MSFIGLDQSSVFAGQLENCVLQGVNVGLGKPRSDVAEHKGNFILITLAFWDLPFLLQMDGFQVESVIQTTFRKPRWFGLHNRVFKRAWPLACLFQI